MKFEVDDVLFLKAQKKKYSFEGKVGEYAFCEVLIEGSVYRLKMSVDLFDLYADTVESRGLLKFEIQSFNGRNTLVFLSFKS